MDHRRDRPKGRAASHNPPNRYHRQASVPLDDGWTDDERSPLRTQVAIDRSRKAITFNDSPDIPFDRSINPYRGCEHGCIYRYARPTHAWLDLSPGLDFESRLFARPGLPALLSAELAAPGYKPSPLAIGSVTDAYQPIERAHGITRQIVEILAGARHPTLLITKSAMIERDIDLLTEMAADDLVEVAVSLTTLDRSLARQMEPRAATPERRLNTIETLSRAGIPVRVMLAPVIPVLTDPEIERLLDAAHAAGATAAGYVLLRLPLEVAPLFHAWLEERLPDAAARVIRRIRDTRNGRDNDNRFGRRLYGSGPYADLIRQRFELASRRLGFGSQKTLRCDLFRPPPRQGQLSVF